MSTMRTSTDWWFLLPMIFVGTLLRACSFRYEDLRQGLFRLVLATAGCALEIHSLCRGLKEPLMSFIQELKWKPFVQPGSWMMDLKDGEFVLELLDIEEGYHVSQLRVPYFLCLAQQLPVSSRSSSRSCTMSTFCCLSPGSVGGFWRRFWLTRCFGVV